MNSIIETISALSINIVGLLLTGGTILYRIKQLEKKVEKHNSVVERVYALEVWNKTIHEQIEKLEKKVG